MDEIARLELELEKQQNEELLQLNQVGFMTTTKSSIHYLSLKCGTKDCTLWLWTSNKILF
jgi:hypothetical protein